MYAVTCCDWQGLSPLVVKWADFGCSVKIGTPDTYGQGECVSAYVCMCDFGFLCICIVTWLPACAFAWLCVCGLEHWVFLG